ncbi:uncharacterized protein E0L32_004085 [Thyridium curvatum]|uniref:O-methyltransferase n=1 Tax=Thyridium curvatum TaxID=1093900 RepID=A0A507BHQ4_9PEZI|nr:uncharacterized protein E0L32_004085 [Thyridium curvatum]TPX16090.1 hypothetical protein E0L32_004085 [Thyridium curvatum]
MASSSDKLATVAAIDTLAQTSLLRPNPRLEHALENSKAKGLPPIAVSPLTGQFLAIQCQLIGAKNVLEVGTLGAYSTIWMAETGAKVTSLEIDPKHKEVALENAKDLDVEVLLGPALETMPRLAQEGRQFDLVFIDADWGEQWEYFDWAVKLTRKKGLIYVDNVVRELLESDKLTADKESLVTQVGKDDRVKATLLTSASSHKGRADEMFDGVLLAVVQ